MASRSFLMDNTNKHKRGVLQRVFPYQRMVNYTRRLSLNLVIAENYYQWLKSAFYGYQRHGFLRALWNGWGGTYGMVERHDKGVKPTVCKTKPASGSPVVSASYCYADTNLFHTWIITFLKFQVCHEHSLSCGRWQDLVFIIYLSRLR